MAVYVNMMGRLGNQMFIYAHARALQEARGDKEIVITSSEEIRLDNFQIHNYTFLRNPNLATGKTLMQMLGTTYYGKNAAGKSQRELAEFEIKHKYFLEKNGLVFCRNGYLDFNVGKQKNIFAKGFFQSEKYFLPIKKKILQEFTPRSLNNIPKNLPEALCENPNAVCVSIRLGDYLNHPVHGVCTERYYVRAMRMMQEKLGTCVFYVSTENPKLIRENPAFSNFDIIYEESKLEDWQKLYLTNQCTNFILTNSTFSWWGYYLSRNREKNHGITIAPNRWFNTDIPCDIYMPDWITIEP